MKITNIQALAEKLKDNSLTEQEFQFLDNWIREEYRSDELDQVMKLHWDKLKNNANSANDERLNEIYQKILCRMIDLPEKVEKETKLIKLYRAFQKVAAVLIIPITFAFIAYVLYLNSFISEENWVEVNSPVRTRTEFHLPDGSSGWLNAGAKLKYNPNMSYSRKVELTGEAYFNVKKRNGKSFVVSTPDMDIKVLGTKFNVMAYPDEALTRVVLEEGKVEAKGTRCSFSKILAPGDKLEFQSDSKLLGVEQVETEAYTAWVDGLLVLDGESLECGVRKLERWYNVDIEIRDEVLKTHLFKATFQDESLEEVIRLLALSTPINYEILPRVMDENGVFMRKKIILKLKQ
ncbi:FecR domain-containing protein [uncultured Draconibacterium sp.]|uniref:FecR family protein n=1 Tax=uncultured Draconibacterium sp. TaxID=1573823 RepID=UPI0032607161